MNPLKIAALALISAGILGDTTVSTATKDLRLARQR